MFVNQDQRRRRQDDRRSAILQEDLASCTAACWLWKWPQFNTGLTRILRVLAGCLPAVRRLADRNYSRLQTACSGRAEQRVLCKSAQVILCSAIFCAGDDSDPPLNGWPTGGAAGEEKDRPRRDAERQRASPCTHNIALANQMMRGTLLLAFGNAYFRC